MPGKAVDESTEFATQQPNPHIPQKGGISPHASSDGVPAEYFRYKGIKICFEQIEKVLVECIFVSEVTVLCVEDLEGDKKLTAFVVPAGQGNDAVIEHFLAEKLPAHMVPEKWVYLENLPLMQDGSVDRKELQDANYEAGAREMIAPRNEVELALANLVQSILEVESVGIHDNFFRLGGSSIHALRLIAAVRREFRLDLDIKCFFVYPTIARLTAHLQSVHEQTSATPGENSAKYLECGESIIPLKSGDGNLPLYIVCGGGGTAFTFEKFAHMMDEDQPVFAFQQPSDISQLETFPDTIEGIAAKYLAELLQFDPHGPYALSGHCIGGVIALEMARGLKAAGKDVKLLAMFDVILPGKERRSEKVIKSVPAMLRKATLKARLKFDFETFLITRHPKQAMEYKMIRLKGLLNKVYPFWKEDADLLVFKRFEEKFEKSFENYQVKKYDGEIQVFYALDHYHFWDRERNIQFRKLVLEDATKSRWKNYGDPVSFHEVEGEHSTIFEFTNFARLVQANLRK